MTGDTVSTALGAGENECPAHFRIGKKAGEERALLVGLDVHDTLRYALGSRCNRGHLHFDRLMQQLGSKCCDLVRHGGGEEQILPARTKLRHDAADWAHKAEILHLVCFVQNQRFDAFQGNRTCLHMVDQTSRCCDEHVDATRHCVDLGFVRDTAKDNGNARSQMAAIGAEAFADLRGELAGGRENQNARTAAGCWTLFAGDTRQKRQCECGRLASARLGNAK
mgnify:CR=1 FL=1